MENVSHDDLIRMYGNTLMMYEGRPVYIQTIYGDKTGEGLDILTQRMIPLEFKERNFSLPPRIGFVNSPSGCLYMHRKPARKYWVGLHKSTMSVVALDVQYRSIEGDRSIRNIQELNSIYIADSILNKYPTLKEAIKIVRNKDLEKQIPCVAFDKQFAVTSKLDIYYRTERVGKVAMGAIVFSDAFKHLSLLLDKSYEKTIPNFGTCSA